MDIDYDKHDAALAEEGLLPDDLTCLYVTGSLVRGWGNASSDLDWYVITEKPWRSANAQLAPVALVGNAIPVELAVVDGRRLDIEYWSDEQVDQVLAKVSWDEFSGGQPAGKQLTDAELGFLERLSTGIATRGSEWLRRRQEQLANSAMRSVMVSRALGYADIYAEDAVGQMDADDLTSAVLSARLALGYAVDALLAGHGEYGVSPKWRARRFVAANPGEVSFEEYWAIETMRSFDPAAPAEWVEEVLLLCRRISMEVSV